MSVFAANGHGGRLADAGTCSHLSRRGTQSRRRISGRNAGGSSTSPEIAAIRNSVWVGEGKSLLNLPYDGVNRGQALHLKTYSHSFASACGPPGGGKGSLLDLACATSGWGLGLPQRPIRRMHDSLFVDRLGSGRRRQIRIRQHTVFYVAYCQGCAMPAGALKFSLISGMLRST